MTLTPLQQEILDWFTAQARIDQVEIASGGVERGPWYTLEEIAANFTAEPAAVTRAAVRRLVTVWTLAIAVDGDRYRLRDVGENLAELDRLIQGTRHLEQANP